MSDYEFDDFDDTLISKVVFQIECTDSFIHLAGAEKKKIVMKTMMMICLRYMSMVDYQNIYKQIISTMIDTICFLSKNKNLLDDINSKEIKIIKKMCCIE